jgi:hypothetical protein
MLKIVPAVEICSSGVDLMWETLCQEGNGNCEP